ncbi:unnamed protein product [Camellia sinensis]
MYDILNKSKNMNGSDYQNWTSKWTRRPCKEEMKEGAQGRIPIQAGWPKQKGYLEEGLTYCVLVCLDWVEKM